MTNCHVVEGASKITVFTSDDEPKEYDGRVIGGDCEHDLAILKIDATGLPTVPLGDSADLQLGQRVVALGYALALEGGPTVTTGIVSSLGRTIRAKDPNCADETCGAERTRVYADIIQTDAAINPGQLRRPAREHAAARWWASTRPASQDAENIGFAIPIDAAKDDDRAGRARPAGAVRVHRRDHRRRRHHRREPRRSARRRRGRLSS